MWKKSIVSTICLAALTSGCTSSTNSNSSTLANTIVATSSLNVLPDAKNRLDIYQSVPLTADLTSLSNNQKDMLALLIDASKIMDELFWQQAYGSDKDLFLSRISNNDVRRFADINYGPWDRLNGDKPFLTDTEAKSLGAKFYPHDMSKAEFESSDFADKTGLYSMVVRNEDGSLKAIPYAQYFDAPLHR